METVSGVGAAAAVFGVEGTAGAGPGADAGAGAGAATGAVSLFVAATGFFLWLLMLRVAAERIAMGRGLARGFICEESGSRKEE